MYTWERRVVAVWLSLSIMILGFPGPLRATGPITTLSLVPAWFLAPAASAPPPGKIDPDLLRAMALPEDLPVRVIVILQTEEKATPIHLTPQGQPLDARRSLVKALQARFEASRMPLATLLDEAGRQERLREVTELWSINGLALTTYPDVIFKLALSPWVAALHLDHARSYVAPDFISESSLHTTPNPVWGIVRLGVPEVWETLAISGTGALVASMDTGVDWLHPALNANYLGNLGHGIVVHQGAWFDAVSGGVYPYDDHGHGTHTTGTAVGSEGIGVAPGARWQAVKVLNSSGAGFDSDIHAGFQWLLAPDGDPALAPDVVVCSWGMRDAYLTTFQGDLETLEAAGILAVFAAGNEGPDSATLRSPASLPGVFAVGASDPYEHIAPFSSRGPSPWGEIKPYVVAPGVTIESAMPGGTYAYQEGTSMATPHVAGVAALLRSISDTLSVSDMVHVITQTALPLTATVPNNEMGWGRLDAYAAVIVVDQPGILAGIVRNASGSPLANATIQVTPYGSTGYPVQTSTGGNGSYQAALRPACYQVKASAFGYASRIVSAVDIITGAVHRLDFTLNPLPTGIVQGTASVTPTTYPPTLPVMISVLNTPVTQTLTPAGTYALELPRGRHVLEVRGNGYYVITATVDVVPGELMELDWMLERAPRLVLVDQGTLYYASVVQYWREGLDRLGHAYDVVPIYDTPLSAGFTTRLLDYDVVLWSAPLGSPGLIGAGPVLESYLAAGGRLLLSGQDVALFDSGGTFYVPPQSYLVEDLAVKYLSDDAPTRDLTGLGPFRPLSVTISGHNGADNQEHPDTITVGDADKATIVWEYAGGAGGGLGAHICTPYRALLFAYGWEAIATSDMRSEVLDRAIDWLVASPPVSGITLEHERAPMIAEPGATITHVVRIRHTGAAGPLDTVTISVMGHRWPTHLSETQFDIPPCTDRYLYVQIDVPADAGVNESDSVRLHIASTLLSQPLTTTLETKTPAALLLVDDDRWYPVEAAYLSTLNRLGVAYDVWDTRHNGEPLTGTTSVSTEMMHRYPLVVWFTGYDWLDPVTEAEEATLLHYLDEGGRLLLSSQDFLYYGETRPLAERLGVLVNNLYLTTTMVSGVRAHAAGGTWGPLALDYPFPNWSDSPEPLPAAEIITRGQFRQPAALAGSGSTPNRWRSIFYAFPLEAVPDETRDRLVDHALGWLSPLGNSSWAISPENPEPGAIVTATLVIRNDGDSTHPFTVAHFIPASLILSEASLPPDVTYVPESRYLQWNDSISAGEVLTRSWRAQLVEDAARGKRVAADVQIELPEWDLGFEYETVIWVTGPNLAQSQWLAPAGGQIEVGEPASLTLALINGEQGGAFSGVVDLWLMPGLALPGATEAPTQGTSSRLWEGNIAPGKTHYLTVVVQAWRSTTPLRIDAVFTSDSGQTWERSLWLAVAPKRLYLPLVMRN